MNQNNLNRELFKLDEREDSKMATRWWKQKASSQSKNLERRWRYMLQEKSPKRDKTLTPPHPHPIHSIPTSCYMEKPGGLLHHQTPAP
jgi:hypothetical protein